MEENGSAMNEEEEREQLRRAKRKAVRKLEQEIAAGRTIDDQAARKKRLSRLTKRFLKDDPD